MKNTTHYAVIALIALVLSIFLSQMEINYPHPSQEESLKLLSLLPVLLFGCLGAYLWD